MLTALAGAVVLAVLSTFYDFVWAHFEVRHNAINGLVHGMTLLSVAGLVLGWPVRRLGAGLAGGAIPGLVAAASFYAFYPLLGYLWAIVAAWMLLWLLFGGLEAWLRPRAGRDRARAGAQPDCRGSVGRCVLPCLGYVDRSQRAQLLQNSHREHLVIPLGSRLCCGAGLQPCDSKADVAQGFSPASAFAGLKACATSAPVLQSASGD